MAISKHFLIAILQVALVILPLLVQAHQDQSAFISIDCGISDVSSYTDETTGINYISDANFIEFGENRVISPEYKELTDEQQLWNVRSFPEGTKNCYTLKPSPGKGTKYLIRAMFMYGNYDNKDQFPTFDLYLGADLWETMKIENASKVKNMEIIHVLSSDHLHVCLVNTGYGIPFISVLELRPLGSDIYVTESGSSLQLENRYDFSSATDQVMRYKDDVYDRLWEPLEIDTWKPFITLSDESSLLKNEFELPFTIMSTAYTETRSSDYLYIKFYKLNSTSDYYFYMHFAELEKLQKNQSREFNIFVEGDLWFGPLVPKYLNTTTIRTISATKADSEGNIDIWLNNSDIATLPPFINAMELYVLKKLPQQETKQADVEAISDVKMAYGLKKIKWQGDPCVPETYLWDGLNCNYKANNQPIIVSLNLSSSGLNGEITPSIANLTMLENLDLSNNYLNGTVPEFLAQLSFLKFLNLEGNNLTGPVPDALLKRSNNGLLLLRIDPNLSSGSCSSRSCAKKKKSIVPLVASLAGGLFFFFLIAMVLIWTLKWRRHQIDTDMKVDNINEESNEEDGLFTSKNQKFTYSEIQRITNNFGRVLGEGGFGKVYHGHLNRDEVAVKMLSSSSVHGHRQFQAELKLLLRVHHKNLTTLVGYCNDGTNIGLIYDYMAMGNLRSHLSGIRKKILSWEERLQIAIDTAQGLEYLHNGCKPPIIHRDVKSTNILLNEKFQAKLGDFGLSKIFPFEGGNQISTTGTPGILTSIAGTPGYLDPEYYLTNWLNEKSDVYSFGVVLLEIITARPALTKTQEDNHIIQWVNSMLAKGDIKQILDPRLEGGFDINTVWKAIEIALACVSRTSTNRPTMARVAIELKECLTSELTRKDGHDDADQSKDSVEVISKLMFSELTPIAR